MILGEDVKSVYVVRNTLGRVTVRVGGDVWYGLRVMERSGLGMDVVCSTVPMLNYRWFREELLEAIGDLSSSRLVFGVDWYEVDLLQVIELVRSYASCFELTRNVQVLFSSGGSEAKARVLGTTRGNVSNILRRAAYEDHGIEIRHTNFERRGRSVTGRWVTETN